MSEDWIKAGRTALDAGILSPEEWEAAWFQVGATADLAGVLPDEVGRAMGQATQFGIQPLRAAAGLKAVIWAFHEPSPQAQGVAEVLGLPRLDSLLGLHGGSIFGALEAIKPTLLEEAKRRGTHISRLLGTVLGSYDGVRVSLALLEIRK